jgi:hypothetical protein
MDEQEARSYGSNEALVREIRNRVIAQQRVLQEPAKPEERKPFKIDLDPEDVHEGLVTAFQATVEQINQQREDLAKIQAELAASRQSHQEQEFQRNVKQFDGWVADLGDEYAQMLGTGDTMQLAPGKERDTRLRIVDNFDALVAGWNGKRGAPDRKQLFDWAVNSVCGDKSAQLAQQNLDNKLKKRSEQAISKPSQRTTHPSSGREKALKRAEEFARQHAGDYDSAMDESATPTDGVFI